MELNFTPFTAQVANEATRAALKEQDEQLLNNVFNQIAARSSISKRMPIDIEDVNVLFKRIQNGESINE